MDEKWVYELSLVIENTMSNVYLAKSPLFSRSTKVEYRSLILLNTTVDKYSYSLIVWLIIYSLQLRIFTADVAIIQAYAVALE